MTLLRVIVLSQNKAFVTRKLVNLKLKEERSIAKHLSEFQDLVN